MASDNGPRLANPDQNRVTDEERVVPVFEAPSAVPSEVVIQKGKLKRIVFRAITLMPLISILGLLVYFVFFTNVPQLLYLHSIRNIYYDCMQFSSEEYVYKMKPGQCNLKNIEFDTILTHDAEGFRNQRTASGYDVATIGDSHAQGWGVTDDQTFSNLLESQFGYPTKNLGIASYGTMRELEVLDEYGKDAKYVILQYCDNDFGENSAALTLSKEDFRSQVEARWLNRIATYKQGKAMGYKKPLSDLGVMIRDRSYTSKSKWRKSAERRNMEQEASVFGQIIERYRPLLEGKRLVVFESADSGLNSTRFAETFGSELRKLNWLSVRVIDTTKDLKLNDYYFLDGHPKPIGHRKLAAALAGEISQWERADPLLKKQ